LTRKKNSDGAERQSPPDAPEDSSQRDGEQSELNAVRKAVSNVTELAMATIALVNDLADSQGAAYAAAIRLALLASASNLIAWAVAFLLIVFGNPNLALVLMAANFIVLAVVFLWLAFNARFINWLKNKLNG